MIEAKFYETYYFCNIIKNLLDDQFTYARNLDEFCGDGRAIHLTHPFDKFSSFHAFIEFIIVSLHHENMSKVDLEKRRRYFTTYIDILSSKDVHEFGKLPIEMAFDAHEIVNYMSFKDYLSENEKNLSSCDEDDIYDYMFETTLSEAFEKLIKQTVEEVFYVLFQNRGLMLNFNLLISAMLEHSNDDIKPEEISSFFTSKGTLIRKPIPRWVQRTVYFRDRGRCVLCNKDLSGITNPDNLVNYDHIVPLAKYGLNDVTNIQLLCKDCNQLEKRDGEAITSNLYQSWY